MAKSLRSKRIRKTKAIKRIRYGLKENQRLEKLVQASQAREAGNDVAGVAMSDIMEQCTVIDSADIIERKRAHQEAVVMDTVDSETSTTTKARKQWLTTKMRRKLHRLQRQKKLMRKRHRVKQK